MSLALEISGLSVSYGERVVLDGANLQVESARITVVVGGSGCGKSTLLRAAIGLVRPSAGRVLLFGQDLAGLPDEEQHALRRRLGIVFQQCALFSSLTVAANVALPLQMHSDLGAAAIDDLVAALLRQVGLQRAEALYPGQLSGGMRKRAALARALALAPELLFCDEPVAGLDPVAAAGLDSLLLTLNRALGTTIVVITQELLSIERLDGRLAMLDGGRVVFTGSVAQARASGLPVVHDFFHPGLRR